MKQHGNKGSRNAAKKVTLNARMVIRCLETDLKKWKAEAKKRGASFPTFVSETLNNEVAKVDDLTPAMQKALKHYASLSLESGNYSFDFDLDEYRHLKPLIQTTNALIDRDLIEPIFGSLKANKNGLKAIGAIKNNL